VSVRPLPTWRWGTSIVPCTAGMRIDVQRIAISRWALHRLAARHARWVRKGRDVIYYRTPHPRRGDDHPIWSPCWSPSRGASDRAARAAEAEIDDNGAELFDDTEESETQTAAPAKLAEQGDLFSRGKP